MNLSSKRHGYSLLELLLAMALMVVVMSLIAGAINIYMVQVAKLQGRVERELVARNSLDMMANDIRAAIQHKATDFGGLDSYVKSLALMNAIEANNGEVDEELEEELTDEEETVFDEDMVSFRPTMLGTSNAIMLDISRLPRLDEYNPLVEKASQRESTVSDIKSIAYFFSPEKGGYDPNVVRRQNEIAGGLYRREIDRAVANFRGDETLQVRPDEFAELVASEVAELGFRYFDGQQWTDSWNSEEEGGFPTAIEISLIIDPERTSASNTGVYQYNGFNQEQMERRRRTVYLPMAEPAPEEEE